MASISAIPHVYNNVVILQRGDGYWNASAMCHANGKRWNDYWTNESTKEFMVALADETGIPVSELAQTRKGGNTLLQGTWVHRRVAIDLARWCSAKFAVRVNGWVEELMTQGHVELPEARQQPRIRSWSERITPAFEAHKRHIVMNCPDGAWSILTATLGEVLLTEDELLRHCLPIEHHNLPDGSMGKLYSAHRQAKAWARRCYLAPLVLPKWRKSDGADFTVEVAVYDAEERRHFESWLHKVYFPQHLHCYLERKFSQREYGLTSASAADNSSRRITGRRAALPAYTLREIDRAGGYISASNAALGRQPQQRLLLDDD